MRLIERQQERKRDTGRLCNVIIKTVCPAEISCIRIHHYSHFLRLMETCEISGFWFYNCHGYKTPSKLREPLRVWLDVACLCFEDQELLYTVLLLT